MSSMRAAVLDALDVPEEYRHHVPPVRAGARWSPEIGAAICAKLAVGMSLNRICKAPDMPDESTVRLWALDEDHPFYEMHERAKRLSFYRMAEDILDIVDDGTNDYVATEDPDNPGYRFNGENVQRSKVRADKRQWMLSKMLPKIYGDKITVDHQGEVNHRVTVRKAKAMDVLEYDDLAQLERILAKAEALQIEGKVVDQPEEG